MGKNRIQNINNWVSSCVALKVRSEDFHPVQPRVFLRWTLITQFIFMAMIFVNTSRLWAGVVLTYDEKSPMMGKMTTVRTLYLQSDRARMEMNSQGGIAGPTHTVILYRPDQKAMYIVNENQRSYRKVTPETLKDLMDPSKGGALTQQMMAELVGKNLKYTKKDTGQVGAWACDHYEGRSGSEKKSEFWITPMSAVGITQDDLKGLMKVKDLFKEVGAQYLKDLPIDALEEGPFQGHFKVKSMMFVGGQKIVDSVLRSKAERKDLPATLFELPSGYKEATRLGL